MIQLVLPHGSPRTWTTQTAMKGTYGMNNFQSYFAYNYFT